MLRKSGCLSNCTHGEACWRRKWTKTAFKATSFKWNDNPRLSFEAFGASIDEGSLSLRQRFLIFIKFNQWVQHRIDPSSSLNVVQASNHDLEVFIELFIELLDWFSMCCDFHSWNTLHNKVCCYCCLELPNIMLSVEEVKNMFIIYKYLNKNCLFRFVTSILSKSMTWISLKPLSARSFNISHPNPPAPITSILAYSPNVSLNYNIYMFISHIIRKHT